LEAEKTPAELEKSLSKKHGEEDFYLEKDREYRSEDDVFDDFTQEERDQLFGRAPATVWENLCALEKHADRLHVFTQGDVMPMIVLKSYCEQTLSQWKTELHDRIIPNTMNIIRGCKKAHRDDDFSDFDIKNWLEIDQMRHDIAKDTINRKCLLTRAKDALDDGEYDLASDLQLEIQRKMNELTEKYTRYKKNLL